MMRFGSWVFVPALLLALAALASAGTTQFAQCQDLSVNDETYQLTADLVNDSTTGCITVSGTGITLDCQGHWINGTSNAVNFIAVKVNSGNSVIKGCSFSAFQRGIQVSATNTTVYNNTFDRNRTTTGLYASAVYLGSGSSTVWSNSFTGNSFVGVSYEIYATSSNSNNISFNNFTSGYRNVYLLQSASNVVDSNRFQYVGDVGALVFRADNNNITSNVFLHGGNYGVQIGGQTTTYANNNRVVSNNFTNFSGSNYVIYLSSAANTAVLLNNFFNINYGVGIALPYASGSVNNNLTSNSFENVSSTAIFAIFNTTVSSNTMNNVTGYGIRVAGSYNNINSNTMNNTNYAIVLANLTHDEIVSSNNCTESDYCYYINGSYNNQLTGNTVSSSVYGLYLAPGSTGNSLVDNDLTATTSGLVYPLNGGQIDFGTAQITGTIDSSTIYVSSGVAAVNATRNPSLNQSARISMPFAGYCSKGVTLYYAADYWTSLTDVISHGAVCDDESTPSCTQVSCTDNSLIVFDVEHFDSYGGQGYDIPEFPGLAAAIAVLLAAGAYAVSRKRK